MADRRSIIRDGLTEKQNHVKDLLYRAIPDNGWSNIHNVIASALDTSPAFTKDDFVFAYWLLLADKKIYGNSPIVWKVKQ